MAMANPMRRIRAQRIITPYHTLEPGEVLVVGGTIRGVRRLEMSEKSRETGAEEVIDLGELTLIPGLIDIHNHGALGSWVGESPEAVVKIAEYLPSTGTTSWLPTIGSLADVETVVAANKSSSGARVIGIHMEGPFLAPKNLPGDEREDLPDANLDLLRQIVEAGGGLVRIVGISPELPGALHFIRELRHMGIRAAIAHTKATYELFSEAVIAGINHVTHGYNVMTGLHHRRPGVVGGILTEDSLTCELISDGYHVHPVAMKVLLRCKSPHRICLITDNVSLAGLPDGIYDNLIKDRGTIRKSGYPTDVDGTLCGSAWPFCHNLSVIVREVGASLEDALVMACLTPAVVAGVAHQKGSIEPGKDADLTAIDSSFRVHWTMVEGEVAYTSTSTSTERGYTVESDCI